MARAKIIAYLPPDLAETIRHLAAARKKSISDIAEDALTKGLLGVGRDVEHTALMAKLDAMHRRLGIIERSQETLFELTAHSARFSMSMAPDVPETDRARINARGAERFRGVIAAITARLGAGKSVWKDNFPAASASNGHDMRAGPANDSIGTANDAEKQWSQS